MIGLIPEPFALPAMAEWFFFSVWFGLVFCPRIVAGARIEIGRLVAWLRKWSHA